MISPGNKNRMACVVCGCTYERPCWVGCGWASLRDLVTLDSKGPLCTVCAEMVARLSLYSEEARRFRVAPLLRAVKAANAASLKRVAPEVRKARNLCRVLL